MCPSTEGEAVPRRCSWCYCCNYLALLGKAASPLPTSPFQCPGAGGKASRRGAVWLVADDGNSLHGDGEVACGTSWKGLRPRQRVGEEFGDLLLWPLVLALPGLPPGPQAMGQHHIYVRWLNIGGIEIRVPELGVH